MFYLNNSWNDFKGEVLDSLCRGFVSGKTILPLKIQGYFYAFDFLRMLQIHISSRNYRSIAWIDEKGKPFFPRRFFDSDFSQSKVIVHTEDENDKKGKKKKIEFEEDAVTDGGGGTNQNEIVETSKFPNANILRKNDKTYRYANNLFMSNIMKIDPHATVTCIHEFQISGTYGRGRWNAFENLIETTKASRGKANVVYGWYAAPTEKVASIFSKGFELLQDYPLVRPSIGAGIFLADLESPQYSGMQYEMDKESEKHVILCRVVLGNVERVDLECHQSRCSRVEYDTGSNDPNNPNWYVVWANDINKRILPVYVVTCKTSAIMNVEWKKFPYEMTVVPKVVLEIKKRMPFEYIPALHDVYDSFKKGGVTIAMLKKQIKGIVGDQFISQMHDEFTHQGLGWR
uniref:Probable inactive poly [ADP-ribose] polymerase SRO3 n=1 Tax=Cicer arietinum TaxID=3827 RepID=A0A1S2YA82_CICAR|nr:probable inactive poly [ADP-ribose] polymerase SRO3 [Cicer arietinum]